MAKEHFLSLKRILNNRLASDNQEQHKNAAKEIENASSVLKTNNRPLPSTLFAFDLEVYNGVVAHYTAYRQLLNTLEIETDMKPTKSKTLTINADHPQVIDASNSIDLTPILDECMGELELLEELISIFERNALEFMGTAKIHIQNTDFAQLVFSSHKIKAGLAMMQTDSLHSIVVQIENNAKHEKDSKHIKFLFDCFAEEYPMVQQALNQALNKIINT